MTIKLYIIIVKTVSIFLLLIYWSIIISAPKISNDFKFGSSRSMNLQLNYSSKVSI